MTDSGPFEEALRSLGLEGQTPTLAQNAADSRHVLERAKSAIANAVPPSAAGDVDVIVLGSFARLEASGESDFDYLVVAHGLPQDVRVSRQLLNAADSFIEGELKGSRRSRQPGATGLFGHITAAPDLTERIGLEQDTNLSHSRRVLILEESRSVYRPDLHERLLRAIMERYLVDYPTPKQGPPRFLLNDIIRYWYTIAVDYQAKRWESPSEGWGLRYLKLLTTRKLAYAGTLASLLQCDDQQPATVDYLVQEFSQPPLARLGKLALDGRFHQREALRNAILYAESFAEFLADGDRRDRVKGIDSREEAERVPEFAAMRELADDLAKALESLFFDSHLGPRARRYLAF